VNDAGLQEYSSNTMGPPVCSYYGYGSLELVYLGGALEQTVEWIHVSSTFFSTFRFTTEDLAQREALCRIKNFIFHLQPKNTTPKAVCSYHQPMEKMKEVVHCWKVEVDDIDDDDPRGIHIK
jgi:hypothetical protein